MTEVDERAVVAKFVLEGAFGILGGGVGEFICLEVQAGNTTDHPVIQLLVGELATVEVGNFLTLLNTASMNR